MTEILFCGDPHGRFDQINRLARERRPAAMVLLGDFDLARPLEQEIAEAAALCRILHIHGNHDTDSEAAHDHLWHSALAEHSIHGRVVEVGGLRIAGLGGVWRSSVWNAHSGEIRYRSRADWLAGEPETSRWRGGVALRQRSSVWPEDYEALAGQRADILVCHEAPAAHRFGVALIDRLAAAMGARLIVHGHHHEDYRTERGGVTVIGVGEAAVTALDGTVLIPGR